MEKNTQRTLTTIDTNGHIIRMADNSSMKRDAYFYNVDIVDIVEKCDEYGRISTMYKVANKQQGEGYFCYFNITFYNMEIKGKIDTQKKL